MQLREHQIGIKLFTQTLTMVIYFKLKLLFILVDNYISIYGILNGLMLSW